MPKGRVTDRRHWLRLESAAEENDGRRDEGGRGRFKVIMLTELVAVQRR